MSNIKIRKRKCNHNWKCQGIFDGNNALQKTIYDKCVKCGIEKTRECTITTFTKTRRIYGQ